MLKKLIKLENVKQWQHNGSQGSFFEKLNLIYGRNGSGKSTLGKIFEYINENDIDTIKSLSSRETEGEPNLNFLFDDNCRVDLKSLSVPYTFQVFNQSFIEKNLYTSKGTESSQLANYYEFSLGALSVTHQTKIDSIKLDNGNLASDITTLSTKIRAQLKNQTIAKIRKIKKINDVENKISEFEKKFQDIKDIEHFRKRDKLKKLSIEQPTLDKSCFITTIASLSKEAQEEVSKHIEANQKDQDNVWIEEGRELVTESNNCPFCGQSLSTSPIYHLYQEFMNEAYLTASNEFELASSQFELDVMDIGVKIEEQEDTTKRNIEIIREWSDRIKTVEPNYDFKIIDKLSKDLNFEIRSLIKAKEKDLLSDSNFSKFDNVFQKIFSSINFVVYNAKIEQFNKYIDTFVSGLGSDTIEEIINKINKLKESKARFSPESLQNLEELKLLESKKSANTKEITDLRDLIATEQEDSIGKSRDSINELLKNFNSMIRIKELKKDNQGHRGASRIIYVMTFIGNELSILNDNQKIFDNVLSMGDRSALALAFFLSKFKDKNTDNVIIALDDPMSSLDVHRRNATIVEIEKLVNNNYQTFIFSHDVYFLSDVLKHSILSAETKCFEIHSDYIDTTPSNPDSSQYISSKLIDMTDGYESYVMHSYHKEYNSLYEFVASGNEDDKVKIARSIRPILEGYLRFCFPKQFTNDKWLGSMIELIRSEQDEQNPLYDRNNRIDLIQKINEFSKNYHHAEGFDTQIQGLEIQTVKNYAKETLCFITGL